MGLMGSLSSFFGTYPVFFTDFLGCIFLTESWSVICGKNTVFNALCLSQTPGVIDKCYKWALKQLIKLKQIIII